jgi:hypothetical protein
MADGFSLQGAYTTTLLSGNASGLANITTPIFEQLTLAEKSLSQYDLTTNTPVTVPFGGLTGAHVVVITVTSGQLTATLTSTAGASQVIPVDTLAILISQTTPYTALTLTRASGIETIVEVFLGQSA